MKIKIVFTSPFSEAVGAKELTIDSGSDNILELIDELISQYPDLKKIMLDDNGRPTDYLSIFINDKTLSALDGMESQLHEGDELLFLFPISGG